MMIPWRRRRLCGSGISRQKTLRRWHPAIVEAVNNYDDPSELARYQKGWAGAMKGIISEACQRRVLSTRGL